MGGNTSHGRARRFARLAADQPAEVVVQEAAVGVLALALGQELPRKIGGLRRGGRAYCLGQWVPNGHPPFTALCNGYRPSTRLFTQPQYAENGVARPWKARRGYAGAAIFPCGEFPI